MITRQHLWLRWPAVGSRPGCRGRAAGLLGGYRGEAAASDYRALVVLFLQGGNDGHNTLIPTDGAFSDYTLARGNLALAKSSLAALPGSAAGHTFALHPGLAPLAPLYRPGRLAWVANVARWWSRPRPRRCWPRRWTCRPSCCRTATRSPSSRAGR